MKKLLNTLYVTSENSYLGLEGETIVVYDDHKEIGRLPLHNLEGIVSFGYRGTSPALMGACAERNISLCYVSPQGKFLARVSGKTRGNVLLRQQQYMICKEENRSLEITKNCITGKVYNARWVLERALRDHAMLSFVYTLLTNQIVSALETVGLDPYVGCLHTDRPGRASLALDLIEELRPVYADRFVISLINKKIVNRKNFSRKENGAVLMDDDLRKKLLVEWQNKKKEVITHPFLKEKVEWGMVPYVQAMLLARYMRGDLDGYPVFLWK